MLLDVLEPLGMEVVVGDQTDVGIKDFTGVKLMFIFIKSRKMWVSTSTISLEILTF